MTDHQRSLYIAIEQIITEIAFVPHKVTSNFSSLSSFSALDLRLAALVDDAHRGQVGIRVKDLFTVEAVDAGTHFRWSSSPTVGGRSGHPSIRPTPNAWKQT